LGLMSSQNFVVLGAGPAGLHASVLLAQQGHNITVYDKISEIPVVLGQSTDTYALGVNRRGLQALERSGCAKAVEDTGLLVNSWDIFAGKFRVASLASGNVYGQTRGQVTRVLYEKAATLENITIKFLHKLVSIDFAKRSLTFTLLDEQGNDAGVTHLDASDARIIAADGVWSRARKCMSATFGLQGSASPELLEAFQFSPSHAPTAFEAQINNWGNTYRCLYSNVGATAPELDPAVHYIFNGVYCSVVGRDRWMVVVSINEATPEEDRQLLLSDEPSLTRVKHLREYLARVAPKTLPLFSEEDAYSFFQRRTYTGAVVKVSHLNAGEWVVLLGDAGHSVLPPTGEGINSGLEDTVVLAECVAAHPDTAFAQFNTQRLPQLHALNEIANFLNEQSYSNKAEKTARVLTRIVGSLPLCRPSVTYEELTFGRKSNPPVPYTEAVRAFREQNKSLSLMRTIVTPFAGKPHVAPPPC